LDWQKSIYRTHSGALSFLHRMGKCLEFLSLLRKRTDLGNDWRDEWREFVGVVRNWQSRGGEPHLVTAREEMGKWNQEQWQPGDKGSSNMRQNHWICVCTEEWSEAVAAGLGFSWRDAGGCADSTGLFEPVANQQVSRWRRQISTAWCKLLYLWTRGCRQYIYLTRGSAVGCCCR
jgi:hypothetical protein